MFGLWKNEGKNKKVKETKESWKGKKIQSIRWEIETDLIVCIWISINCKEEE